MYFREDNNTSFYDFNESCGMQFDMKNELIVIADSIPWEKFGKEYSDLFPSCTGRPSYSFRMAVCTLILKARDNCSDRKIVQSIQENPYYQYFIGMKSFSCKKPSRHSTVINFRKRLKPEIVSALIDKINNFLSSQVDRDFGNDEGQQYIANYDDETCTFSYENENLGTLILDATCSPSNIKYPQDYVLLNDSRKITEGFIDELYAQAGKKGVKPRTYRRGLDKKFIGVAKQRRKNSKELRSLIRTLLNSVNRNIGYIEKFKDNGYCLSEKDRAKLDIVKELYDQQKYMFQKNIHKVPNRIVSIDQPYIRPIVRGKAKSPVEFGAKYDVSIDDTGLGRLEKISFDPYNESTILQMVIERFKEIHGHYPKRVLVDQIYRTRDNLKYCSKKNITVSGHKLGRPSKDDSKNKEQKAEGKKNNTDRIEIERFFSTTKRAYGANLIWTRLEDTTFTTIGFTILAANLFTVWAKNPIFLFLFFESGPYQPKSTTIWLLDD